MFELVGGNMQKEFSKFILYNNADKIFEEKFYLFTGKFDLKPKKHYFNNIKF